MENSHRFESECAPAASPRGANWSGKRRRAGPLAAVFAVAVLLSTGASFADGGLHLSLDFNGNLVRPTPMGVSGGNINHVDADGACHNGTFGALLTDGTYDYILSVNHVFAMADNTGEIGDDIIQPGLVDLACDTDRAAGNNVVGVLSAIKRLNFDCTPFAGKRLYVCSFRNVVDAAIAKVLRADPNDPTSNLLASPLIMDLDGDGVGGNVCSEFYYSTVNSGEPDQVTVGMPVCKSGRTTGLTCSKVSAIDVTVAVLYCGDCDEPPVASFLHQIMVKGGDFAGPGDSGSFLVNSLDRKAVGLVFAGSRKEIVANPIDAVLAEFNVDIVGDDPTEFGTVCGTPIAQAGGGGGNGNKGKGPGSNKPSGAGMAIGLEVARDVKRRHEDELFGFPGVVGTGIGADKAGRPVIEVYLAVGGSIGFGGPQIPDELEGVPVRAVVTGPFLAY